MRIARNSLRLDRGSPLVNEFDGQAVAALKLMREPTAAIGRVLIGSVGIEREPDHEALGTPGVDQGRDPVKAPDSGRLKDDIERPGLAQQSIANGDTQFFGAVVKREQRFFRHARQRPPA